MAGGLTQHDTTDHLTMISNSEIRPRSDYDAHEPPLGVRSGEVVRICPALVSLVRFGVLSLIKVY